MSWEISARVRECGLMKSRPLSARLGAGAATLGFEREKDHPADADRVPLELFGAGGGRGEV